MKLEARKTIDMRDHEYDTINGKVTATVAMLNQFSIYASEAAERYKSIGAFALARNAEKDARKIYEALESLGLYDD